MLGLKIGAMKGRGRAHNEGVKAQNRAVEDLQTSVHSTDLHHYDEEQRYLSI